MNAGLRRLIMLDEKYSLPQRENKNRRCTHLDDDGIQCKKMGVVQKELHSDSLIHNGSWHVVYVCEEHLKTDFQYT